MSIYYHVINLYAILICVFQYNGFFVVLCISLYTLKNSFRAGVHTGFSRLSEGLKEPQSTALIPLMKKQSPEKEISCEVPPLVRSKHRPEVPQYPVWAYVGHTELLNY